MAAPWEEQYEKPSAAAPVDTAVAAPPVAACATPAKMI